MNALYEPAAQAEVTEAVHWYLGRRAGHRQCIRAPAWHPDDPTADALSAARSAWMRASRKLRLDGFPYTVHYRLNGEVIQILAVANQRRKPGYWRGR